MTKKEVRDIVRDVLRSELLKIPNKTETEKIAKDIFKDSITEKDVKDMIRDTMLKYHRWMWEKKGMWINQI